MSPRAPAIGGDLVQAMALHQRTSYICRPQWCQALV